MDRKLRKEYTKMKSNFENIFTIRKIFQNKKLDLRLKGELIDPAFKNESEIERVIHETKIKYYLNLTL